MITGLELDDGLDDLAAKFNVTLEAIALQTRHIVDEMNAKGHKIDSIYMSGVYPLPPARITDTKDPKPKTRPSWVS